MIKITILNLIDYISEECIFIMGLGYLECDSWKEIVKNILSTKNVNYNMIQY